MTNKVVVKRNSLARLAAVRCVCLVSVNNPRLPVSASITSIEVEDPLALFHVSTTKLGHGPFGPAALAEPL